MLSADQIQQAAATLGPPPGRGSTSGATGGTGSVGSSDPWASYDAQFNAPAAPSLNPDQNTQPNLGTQLQGRVSDFMSASENQNLNPVSKMVQQTGAVAGGVNDIVNTGLKAVENIPGYSQAKDLVMKGLGYINPAVKTGEDISQAASKVASTPQAQDTMTKASSAFDTWAQQHPEAAKDLASVGNIAQAAGTVALGAEGVGAAGETMFTKGAGEAATAAGDAAKAGELSKIQDMIQPKATTKEVRLAQTEGRLVKGQEPTLFKSGTADEILPSDKTVKASQTIQQQIPGASAMNETELHNALDSKITDTAQALKPEMQNVPIDQKATGKVFDQWNALKDSQAKEPDFLDHETGNKALQNQFETRLKALQWDIQDPVTGKMKAPTPKTLDDFWEARKSYDDSVPDNVKKANSMSDSKLQYRKQMWLDNRKILTDAINDAETGLGDTSKKAFSDMHDMYNAKEGLLSKAKLEKVGQPSKLDQVVTKIKKHPVVTTAATLGAGYELAKKLGK